MNLEGSKNIIILMLVIVNLTLGGFSLWNTREYKLSQAQKDTIDSVLSKNNVSLYTDIPLEFKPMRIVKLELLKFSKDEIINMFFDGDTLVEVSSQQETDFYTLGDKKLKFERNENTFYFDAPVEVVNTYAFCDEFINKMNLNGIVLLRDNVADGGNIIEYRAVYKNYIIHTDFLSFEFSKNGVLKIRMSLSVPVGFEGDTRNIYSADTTLFKLMFRLKNDSPEDEIIKIVKMDIVYCVEEIGEESVQIAAPYYRVYIRNGDKEIQSEPYLVNAYNNNIKR